MVGPGYSDSGWKGESRYRTMDRPNVARNVLYVIAIEKTLSGVPDIARNAAGSKARTKARKMMLWGSNLRKYRCVICNTSMLSKHN